jgi:transposase InsO family protein
VPAQDLKMWAHLQRCGMPVARCTVERLMRARLAGCTRERRVRTTVAVRAAVRAPDLVKRQFTADRPDQLHVAEFTYVPMVSGFSYTTFVLDAFAGAIGGWECSLSQETALVERVVRQAAARRRPEEYPLCGQTIHHSDSRAITWSHHAGKRHIRACSERSLSHQVTDTRRR